MRCDLTRLRVGPAVLRRVWGAGEWLDLETRVWSPRG